MIAWLIGVMMEFFWGEAIYGMDESLLKLRKRRLLIMCVPFFVVIGCAVMLSQTVTKSRGSEERRMSEPVMLAIVGGVVTIVTTVFGGIMTVYLAKIQKQGAAAAVLVADVAIKTEQVAIKTAEVAMKTERVAARTEEVRNVLETNTKEANKQLGAIHTLVNANMGAQLKISALALRRLAVLTNNMDDMKAAEVAENFLNEHMSKQASVDGTAALAREKEKGDPRV